MKTVLCVTASLPWAITSISAAVLPSLKQLHICTLHKFHQTHAYTYQPYSASTMGGRHWKNCKCTRVYVTCATCHSFPIPTPLVVVTTFTEHFDQALYKVNRGGRHMNMMP